MNMLSRGDTVGIVACSNGLDENMKDKISELIDVLKNIGLKFMKNILFLVAVEKKEQML